jgi:calcineurin-like phosphoesterase family protein
VPRADNDVVKAGRTGRRTSRRRLAVISALAFTAASVVPAAVPSSLADSPTRPSGYWLFASDGGIFTFGAAPYRGPNRNQGADIAAMAATPTGAGYWMVDDDGDVFAYGDAGDFGSRASEVDDVAAMAARPQGDGYWMATRTGSVDGFGAAAPRGGVNVRLSKRIVTMASSPSGGGYWMAGRDGGVFAFGDAPFLGSMGANPINQPVVGMAATPTGRGYWLVAADGGIFAFGDATFLGSMGGTPLNQAVVGMAATPTGRGYWLVASDGGIFTFGDATFLGSMGGTRLNRPVVGMMSLPATAQPAPPAGPNPAGPPGSDTSPPDTWFASGPPAQVNPGPATFNLAANEPGSRFACSLDGAPFSACATPYTVSDATQGNHTLAVRATDTSGNTDPTPAPWSWQVVPLATLVGAGDIADCNVAGDEATARLLDDIPGTVFTAGDNAYDVGSASQFANCYNPTWGRHKARTRPAPGNHDYGTAGASEYYRYFGAAAGEAGKGYYSYDLAQGAWHVIVINSNCSTVACGIGSPQERWLRADLAASRSPCTVAYWHHPRFSSADHGSDPALGPIWQALFEGGADLVVAGHDHTYERFAPQRPDAVPDLAFGIRSFVVGTGGRSHYAFKVPLANSEKRDSTSFGVLKLTLRAGSYDWAFVPVAGSQFTDSGSGFCHGAPPA